MAIKRKLFLALLVIFLLPESAQANITTKEEANKFLQKYCIEIVNGIKDAYGSQVQAAKEDDWELFARKGRWIGALADVYSKVCK